MPKPSPGNATYTAQYKIKDDLSYTVHYYWNGTNDKVAEDKTVDGKTFNETVTETPVPVPGYTPVSADSKTITIGTGTNEITFYYYKNVTLTAEDRIVTYNGQEQTVNTGYDVVVKMPITAKTSNCLALTLRAYTLPAPARKLANMTSTLLVRLLAKQIQPLSTS